MKIFQVSFRSFLPFFMLCFLALASLPLQAEHAEPLPEMPLQSCPTADFYIANNGVPAGTGVLFINQSTGASSYLWDFGDGSSSRASNPTHVYNTPGTYRVTLYATYGACTVAFIGTEDVLVF